MAITGRDSILAARASGLYYDTLRYLSTTLGGVTTSWYHDAHTTAIPPNASLAHTAFSSNGAITNAATTGALPLPFPAGSNKRYIHEITAWATAVGFQQIMLVDYLYEGGTILLTANATTTPASVPALTRYTGTASVGNYIMCELVSTLTHTVAPVVTITYEDQGGTSSSTSFTCPATGLLTGRVIGNVIAPASATVNTASPFVPLATGDTGVRRITAVQVSGGTCTVGTMDVVIVRPLVVIPIITLNIPVVMDCLLELVSGSDSQLGCLRTLVFTASTTAAASTLHLRTVEG